MLETERLILRRFTPADLDDYARAAGDPEVMRFIGHGTPLTRAETEAVLERYMERWRKHGIGHFAVERRVDGRVLGRVGFVFWDPQTWTIAEPREGMQMELGWLLARDAWGHGYATEAAAAARAWVYAEREPSSLVSVIVPANVASQAVARRLGATCERRVELAEFGPADLWLHPR